MHLARERDDKYEKLEKAKDEKSCKTDTPISKAEDDLYFFRKIVKFIKFNEVEINPLIESLTFIKKIMGNDFYEWL